MRVWINFKELRSRLKFEAVLRHYNIEVRRKGDQHQGFCPLPSHEGKGNSPSFSANLERGIFQCFGCGAKGNVLEFACLMSGNDPHDGDALRSVAVELQQRFLSPGTGAQTSPQKKAPKLEGKSVPVAVNMPLDFDLKGLEHDHPYLAGRGFTAATMAHFGVGFCARGMLKDRIAIPLHNHEGKLLGYAGRVIDDALVTEDNPRYRFPSRRERGGTIYELKKSLFVYNGHRIKAPCDDLIVVEGFPSIWWLNQCGLPSSVALMGSACSGEQAEQIVSLVKPSGRIWFMPDGDKAGLRFAESFLSQVAPFRFVRWVQLDQDRQPTDLVAEDLKARFAL